MQHAQIRESSHERPTPSFGNRALCCSYSHVNLMEHTPTLSPRLVASNGVRPAAVTLLSNAELDTLALGQRHPWLLLADDATTISDEFRKHRSGTLT
jgi:hypothetical protein